MTTPDSIPQPVPTHGPAVRALSLLLAMLMALPAPFASAGLLGDTVSSFKVTADLSRRSSQENAVTQAAAIITTVAAADGAPFPKAPPFVPGPVGKVPTGGGYLPTNVGAPTTDSHGAKLGYCSWDNSGNIAATGYLQGTMDVGKPVFAVVSADLKGIFNRSCDDIATGANLNNGDYVVPKSTMQVRLGVRGTLFFGDPVPDKVALDALVTATPAFAFKSGEMRLVKDTNSLWRWDDTVAAPNKWVTVSNTYSASNVQITGGQINGTMIGNTNPSTGAFTTLTAQTATIAGGSLNNTSIGATVASTGAFTTLAASGAFSAGGNATFGGTINATGSVTAGSFIGNGAALTNLNGSAIASGIVAPAFGGTGINASAAPSGALLIGNGSGFTLGALAAGAGIGITTGPGSILVTNTGVTTFNARTGAVVLTLADVNGATNFNSNSLTLGSGALSPASAGTFNTGIGSNALGLTTTGVQNTAVGSLALSGNTTGYQNTAVGMQALQSNTSGYNNAAFGKQALYSNVSGDSNAAIGISALMNSTGSGNAALGAFSGQGNTTGSNNTILGRSADVASGALTYATALGSGAQVSTSNTIVLGRTTDKTVIGATGDDGTAYNLQVTGGIKASSGGLRVAGGDLVLNSATITGLLSARPAAGVAGRIYIATDTNQLYRDDGTSWNAFSAGNVALSSLTAATASNTINNGANAQAWNWNLTGNTTAFNIGENTASTGGTGTQYLANIGTLAASTAIPLRVATRSVEAFRVDSSNPQIVANAGTQTAPSYSFNGSQNTGFYTPGAKTLAASINGTQALYMDDNGSQNTALGMYAGAGGSGSTVLGFSANSGGNYNTAVGRSTLKSGGGGGNNTAVGATSLRYTTGSNNTALGINAGFTNATGGANTLIGAGADVATNALTYATALGSGAIVSTGSTIVLGRTTDKTVIGATGDDGTAYNLQVTGGIKALTGGIKIGAGTATIAPLTLQAGVNLTTPAAGSVEYDGANLYFTPAAARKTIAFVDSNITGTSGNVTGIVAIANGGTGASTASGARANLNAAINGANNDITSLSGLTTALSVAQGGTGTTTSTGTGSVVLSNAPTLVTPVLGAATATTINNLTLTNPGTAATLSLANNSTLATAGAFSTTLTATGTTTLTLPTTGTLATLAGPETLTNKTIGTGSTWNGNIVGTTYGGTGINGSTAANGTLLIGNSSGFTLANLTAGSGMNITNGTGSITLANTGVTSFNTRTGAVTLTRADVDGTQTLAASAGAGAGEPNLALGVNALGGGVARAGNVAIGQNALSSMTGAVTFTSSTRGTNNTAVGYQALKANTTGRSNSAIGYNALASNTTGVSNVASGDYAMYSNTTGNYNLATGSNALFSNTTGVSNVASGSYAMYANTTGLANVAAGDSALSSNITGSNNVATGFYALTNNTTGSQNAATGYYALLFNTTGDDNVAAGNSALSNNTTGYRNVATGSSALSSNTTGTQNAALGYFAGYTSANNITASNSSFLGSNATIADTLAMTGSGRITLLGAGATASGLGTAVPDAYMAAVGSGAAVTTVNTVVLGRATDKTVIGATGDDGTAYNLQVTGGIKALTGGLRVEGGDLVLNSATVSGLLSARPAAGVAGRIYIATDTNQLYRDDGTSWSAFSAGNVALSSLTPATAANTINNGANAQAWNWNLNANTTAFNIGENIASTGGTGMQTLANIGTLAASTAIPLRVSARGVEAFRVDSMNPQIVANAGTQAAPSYSFNGSQNTGFYAPAANELGASVNGTKAMRLTSGSTALGYGSLLADTSGNTTAIGKNALASNTTGGGNVAIGDSALQSATTGGNNTAIGNRALGNNTTGIQNQAIGDSALFLNNGNFNIAIGNAALLSNTTASNNIGIGAYALSANTTGDSNVALGSGSLNANTTGSINSAIGISALNSNTTGQKNNAFGGFAMKLNTTGEKNVAIGNDALYSNSIGNYNTAVGVEAMYSNSSGSNNTAQGIGALNRNTTGSSNTGIGNDALYSNSSGNFNASLGEAALYLNTIGYDNVALGRRAGYADSAGISTNANTTGSNNTFLGNYARPGTTTQLIYATALGSDAQVSTANTIVLGRTTDKTVIGATGDDGTAYNLQVTGGIKALSGGFNANNGTAAVPGYTFAGDTSTGFYLPAAGQLGASISGVRSMWVTGANVALGTNALALNTTGSSNIAVGNSTLYNNSTGSANVALGVGVLASNTTGTGNTAAGNNAMNANTTANDGSAFGSGALLSNTIGSGNSAFGNNALYNNTTGGQNSAVGAGALGANTTGGQNTAFGFQALANNSNGNGNIALSGYQGLYYNTTGSDNFAAGRRTLFSNVTGSNNIALGYNALYSTTGDGNVALGGSSAGSANTTGSNNVLLGNAANVASGALSYATALGAGANVSTSGTIVLGRSTDKTVIGATGDDGSAYNLQVTGGIKALSGGLRVAGGDLVLNSPTITGLLSARPTAGVAGRIYIATDTNQLYRDDGTSWNAFAAGNVALSSITAATAPNTINNGANAQAWNWNLSGNTTAFNIGENIASTGGTGTQTLVNIGTLAASTAIPLGVSTRGVEALRIDNINPQIVANVGNAAAPSYSFNGSQSTGFYSPATNELGASVNGIRALRITAAGSVALGGGSLLTDTSQSAVAIGTSALAKNTTGYGNTGVGIFALANSTTGGENNAIGAYALYLNTSGNNNVAIGNGSLQANTAGNSNTAAGDRALQNNTTGGQNSAVGAGALGANTTGGQNTAFGFQALANNSNGNGNIALSGYQGLYYNTTGSDNFAAGRRTLFSNVIGNNNIALGYNALYSTTGDGNIALGGSSGNAITTGSNNVLLGNGTNVASGALTYATALGASASVSTSSTIVLGRTTDKTVIGATGDDGTAYNLQVTGGIKALTGGVKIGAGTATIAPLQLTSGTNLTTATAGSVEYDGANLYFTPAVARKTVAFLDSNITGNAANVTGVVAVANGGTGANNAAGARTNLGAAASGANSDITSLSGLTTALSVPQGGTGATTLTGILKGNGTSALTAATAGTDFVVGGTTTVGKIITRAPNPTSASVQLTSGASDPSAPALGDFWNNGGVLKFYNVATKTISFTDSNITGNAANVTGVVAVANGGTGATTAASARTNLGAAASGANSDITSLTGLTTALSVAQGGTGINGSTAASGTLLIGNGTGYTLANITAGTGIGIANGAGSITISSTPPLSSITAATAANSINNGINAQTWNWALTGNTTAFSIIENTASAGGTGTQYLQKIGTLAASTAIPLSVSTRAVEAFRVDSINPQIVANAGTAAAPSYSFNGSQSTGFYAPASNELGASIAGARSMRLNATMVALGSGAMPSNSATGNTAVGVSALAANSTAQDNTAVGLYALQSVTTGGANTALGRGALRFGSTTGTNNVAVGTDTQLYGTGAQNTSVGMNAMYKVSGLNNIAIGYSTGNNFTNAISGNGSTFIGASAGTPDNAIMAATGGITLVGAGTSASGLAASVTGSYMTAIGNGASVTTVNTVVLGTTADKTVIGASGTDGSAYNLQVTGGIKAVTGGVSVAAGDLILGSANISGTIASRPAFGVANRIYIATDTNEIYRDTGTAWNKIGSGAAAVASLSSLTAATAGNTLANAANAQAWNWSLAANTTGFAIGETAAATGGTGTQYLQTIGTLAASTAIPLSVSTRAVEAFRVDSINPQIVANAGTAAAPSYAFNGSQNTGFYLSAANELGASVNGTRAMRITTIAGGSNNTLGLNALANNTTGDFNQAFGTSALLNNTSGYRNTAIGSDVLYTNTTGLTNSGLGFYALKYNTIGSRNTAVGGWSLHLNTSGSFNQALGYSALYSNTTGQYNIALGYTAMGNSTTGSNNAAIGNLTLQTNTIGADNSAFGSGAGANDSAGTTTNGNVSGSNNTFIGSYARPGSSTQLNYATALGSNAQVTTGNTIVLGRTTDKTVIGATGDDGTAYNLQVTGGIKALTGGVSVAAGDLILGSANISGTIAARPAFGVANRIYIATDTNEIYRDTGTAWNKIGSGAVAVASLSSLTAATAANTIANAANAQAWNWSLAANTTGFAISETAAATGGTGTQYLQTIGTLAASTAIPLSVSTRAVEAFRVDSINPQIVANVGTVVAPSYAFNGSQGTGFYSSATDEISASIAGVRSMRLAASGVALGLNTLASNTGANNTAVGLNAMRFNTTGNSNTGLGARALYFNQTGSNNVAVGNGALDNAGGSFNTGVGVNAIFNGTGSSNSALGYLALQVVNGSDNTAMGAQSLPKTSGSGNTSLGSSAGYIATNTYSGTNSTFIGRLAGIPDNAIMAATGRITLLGAATSASGLGAAVANSNMTAIGYGASVTTVNTVVLGTTADKTVIGATGTDGSAYNLQVTGGIKALTGGFNANNGTAAAPAYTFAGQATTGFYMALAGELSASVAGTRAMWLTTGGSATGVGALANDTAFSSTAFGAYALNTATTGANNTAIGEGALFGLTTGSNNVALGKRAGHATSANNSANTTTTGSNNTFLGANAMSGTPTQLTYATALGSDALVTTSSTIILGRTTDNVAIGQTNAGAYQFTVNGTAGGTSAYTVASDVRFKTNIRPVVNALDTITALQGVHYEFNQAAFPDKKFESGTQLGFIAQQIEQFVPEVVRTDRLGYKSVQYSQLVPLLAEGIKAQQQILKHLAMKDPATLLVDIKTLQANDAIFENIKSTNIKAVNLEAETARIKKLQADSIESKLVRSDVVKTGEVEVFVSMGMFQPIFTPQANSQYIVNATAEDGSSAFVSVAFMAGKITVTPISGKGVDVTAIGSQVGLVASSKKIKATWIRMS